MDSADYPIEISVNEARHLLGASPAGALLVDVREPHELEICRVEGSRHIPMRQIPEQLGTLPKDRHLLVMCHSGVRSMRVTEYLRANGYAAASNVGGGIAAWADQIEPSMRRY